MDLWIRTQHNKLLKVCNIQKNFNSVIAITQEEGIVNLGEYATEERALEVLDEIQNHTILNQFVPPEHRFYKMPKE